MKYRKKPVVIDAKQFNPPCADSQFVLQTGSETTVFLELEDDRGSFLRIKTLEGDHRADPGDWIIRGIKGEFYPCKDEIFRATYEQENGSPV